MRGRQFITVAQELAEADLEPHWRSAISRAYYAAFHEAKDALAYHSIAFEGTGNDHALVVRYLGYAGDQSLGEAGTGLGGLQESRRRADYALRSTEGIGQPNAKLCILQAQLVIRKIEESPLRKGDPTSVVKAIRAKLAMISPPKR